MPVFTRRRRPARPRAASACRSCIELPRLLAGIAEVLGEGWWEHCSQVAGWFSIHHQDGRRILFYPPHNTTARVVTAYLEVPGELGHVGVGAPLQLPLDVDAAAAAEAVARMPIAPQPAASELAADATITLPAAVGTRIRLGRLRALLQQTGGTVSEVRRLPGESGSVDASGAFGNALFVVDADGRVRFTVHDMPADLAEAAISALGAALPV